MKKLFVVLFVFIGAAACGQAAEPAPKQQPVFVYLYARITDHVNLDLSEDRLRRLLPMIERYRKEHPAAHVSATVLFSGAISEALAQRNGKTHIVDFVQDYIHRGVVEPGYDSTDEPTYKHRPASDFSKTKTAEERWALRVSTAERMLTESRDPLTGAPRSGEEGGLKRMQAVFGPAACITGTALYAPDPALGVMPELGPDSETVHVLRRLDPSALLFGISDTDPLHSPIYRQWSASFSKEMSPDPETSPELYWQDNRLRSSESSEADLRLFHASDGPYALQKVLSKLDRSKIRILHVELAGQRNYIQPAFTDSPLKFAYEHPAAPTLPAAARRPADDVDAAYALEEGALKSLAADFFPANAGSRFVSSAALLKMAGPSTGYRVTLEGLRAALKAWGAVPAPPMYFHVDGRYLSLADMFQAMADVLADFDRHGKFPESVQVVPVFGPTETTRTARQSSGEVSMASVAHACTGLAARLHDDAWAPVPKNSIPFHVTVDGTEMNSAQFLRLMADAIAAPSPESKLPVKKTDMFWGPDAIYYRSRSVRDEGASWTFKPALLAQ